MVKIHARGNRLCFWIAQAARLGSNWRDLANMLLVTADEALGQANAQDRRLFLAAFLEYRGLAVQEGDQGVLRVGNAEPDLARGGGEHPVVALEQRGGAESRRAVFVDD